MTTATIYIERDGVDDIAVLVTGTYHRGYKGRKAHPMDRFAEPDEPAYVELTSAIAISPYPGLIPDAPVELTAAETERAEEALYESAMDDLESDREAAAEARARRLEERE